MMIVAIAHTTSRHTTSTTGTTTAVLIVAPVTSVDIVVSCTGSVSVMLVLSVVMVTVDVMISSTAVVSAVVTMVTGSVLSREAQVVTVCDSAIAVDSDDCSCSSAEKSS